MEPIQFDITIVRGASYRRRIIFAQNGATIDNGWTPRHDFTGCEARMQIRSKAGVEPAWLDLTETPSDDGHLVVGGAEGYVDIVLTRTGSAKLVPKKGYHDIFLEWPNGVDGDCIAYGMVSIRPNVTEPPYD